MDIAVAGGSIAGLCAGTALHSAGYDVHVFERSAGRLTSQGAGIVVQPELLGLLAEVGAPPLATTACTRRRTLSGRTGQATEMRMPQRFTSWQAVYAALSAAFPPDRYHLGSPVEIGDTAADGVAFTAAGQERTASLMVAADGFRSAIRSQFAPGTLSRYAGYIAWRGLVEEGTLPPDLAEFFDDTFSFCKVGPGGHALCYFIPGNDLATEPGRRRLNWVWYVPVREGPRLKAVMTDHHGHTRDASVPPGLVNDDALADLYRRAGDLDPHFAQVVHATPDPFIQMIVDVAPPAMVFDRVCLIGDAAFVVRPHTAAAAAKAAADATALARTLRGKAPDYDGGLAAWERLQMPMGRELMDYGVMLGERST